MDGEVRDINEDELKHRTALQLLPEPLQAAFSDPPPRELPPGTLGRCAKACVAVSFWAGVALTCTGGLYTMVFVAMKAPWQIPAASGAVAAVGAVLLAKYVAGASRMYRLLRSGTVVDGSLEAIAKVDPGSPRPAFGTSVEFEYSFVDPGENERWGSTYVLWHDRFAELEPGQAVPVCFDPRRSKRHVTLLSIV